MENVAVSRRNKGNKENAQPVHGSKAIIKRDKTALAPFNLKSNDKEETLAKNVPLKAKAKQADTRSTFGDALKKVKTVQKDGKRAAASDVTQRQTYSRAFHTEQATKHKKIVAEAPKPPTAVQPPKSAPGMYKGKIVQSKIGSIWKSSTSVDKLDVKITVTKTTSQRIGNATKGRSKSVSDLAGHGTQRPASTTSKMVVRGPAQVSRPPVTSRPAGFYSARPPTRTVPATLTSTCYKSTSRAPTKASGTQDPKPKIPAADKKVNKPPVSSTLSQYRFTKETAEEKRAKLAAWQASKGKTFKRPAMTTAPLPKTQVSKPVADLKSQSQVEPQPQPATQHTSEPSLEAREPDVNSADTQGAELTTCNQTPVVMNTTLELLENSDDLLDPQCTVDDVVVNLCEALEAMATPSTCSDDLPQVSDECSVKVEDDKSNTECVEETVGEMQEESQDVCDQQKVEHIQNETERSDGDKAEKDDADEEVESDDDDSDDDDDYESDDVMDTTPPMEGASEIKYSVKTTPYLQSVKKLIEGEVSTSRRKSNIKDLKFLTPVRRSSRIQRKSSQLPTMLVDHDPCVSSLAELVKLNDDANAYVYRKNPALLHDLPDQTSL